MRADAGELALSNKEVWKSMKQIDRTIAWGIVAIGLLHCLMTPVQAPRFGAAAMWFFSGGIALMSLGAFNLLRIQYGSWARGLWWVCVAANVAMTLFAVVYAVLVIGARVWRSPSFLMFLALLASATVFSIMHSPLLETRAEESA